MSAPRLAAPTPRQAELLALVEEGSHPGQGLVRSVVDDARELAATLTRYVDNLRRAEDAAVESARQLEEEKAAHGVTRDTLQQAGAKLREVAGECDLWRQAFRELLGVVIESSPQGVEKLARGLGKLRLVQPEQSEPEEV